jgi:hypothetical protein
MFEHKDHSTCPACFTEVWPGEIQKEREEYNTKRKRELYSLAAQATALNSKTPLPPGEPTYKGGSKSGKRRKKKPKRDRFEAFQ